MKEIKSELDAGMVGQPLLVPGVAGKGRSSGLRSSLTWLALLTSVLLVAGCRSQKQSKPPPPFMVPVEPGAGGNQPQAQRLPGQPPAQAVYVLGKVTNHVIPWTENLTLAQALIAAQYQDMFDPRVIFLVRQGQATRIDPKMLLKGKVDPVLLPGDVVQIQN